MTRTLTTFAVLATLLAGTAGAATPAQTCESRKNTEAGKYVRCVQKAKAKLPLTGNQSALATALQKCSARLQSAWTKAERRAGNACPSKGDHAPVQLFLDTTSTDVAMALGGEPLAGDGHRLKSGQALCWSGFASNPIPCPGSGRDGEFQKGLDRYFVDNGDGTITDLRTGLMWEKLSDDGSIHDTDNDYTWLEAFHYKVAGLNAIGFAGYTDWRLPNVNELQSILDYGAGYPAVPGVFQSGCTPGCTVLTCSCAWRVGYTHGVFWTSTTYQSAPLHLWTVGVYDGTVGYTARTQKRHARAVRGGS